MSMDQSAYGSFKFKKTNYLKVMRLLRDRLNEFHNYNHEVATVFYDFLKENKIKKNFNDASNFLYDNNLDRLIERKGVKNASIFGIDSDSIHFALSEMFRNNNNTILKPRRSAYPKLINKQKSFYIEFETAQLTISANESSNSITWRIAENNRNVDRVSNSFYSALLFPILHDYKWSKGEGGVVKIKEESMSDFDEDDDYNISFGRKFGDIGEKIVNDHYDYLNRCNY